jgi:amino acid adenylation domain-containing protein
MKILLTMNLPYFPIHGGANKINRAIAEGLIERGHLVEVVVPALGVPSRLTHRQFIDELASAGIEVVANDKHDTFILNGVTVHAVREPAQLRTCLIEQLEKFGPDWTLLSSEDPSHNLLDAVLSVCPDKIIYLVHTVSFLPFGPQAFFPSRSRAKLLERVAAIVSISNFVARYIKQWGDLESQVIYWPCYGAGPFPDLSNFESGSVTMVNACAIKGISIFLPLAHSLPEVEFAAVLTWGAVDEDRRALERLANVRLLEPSRDIDEILSRTRVLLMPSLWEESFGLMAVEAMLRGIPVLASDIGGLPEAKLGTNFLLPVRPIERFGERLNENMLPIPVVPEQDISPWRDSLQRLLSDRNLYETQSAAARSAALEFVSGLSLDPLEKLLTDLTAQPQAAHKHIALAKAVGGSVLERAFSAEQQPGELAEGLDALTPEQQSLLMLMLRQKAAKQIGDKTDESGGQLRAKTIERRSREGKLQLSFAQQRLWFLDQFEPNSAVYNLPAAIRFNGILDTHALEKSFNEVVRRHEILRTRFPFVDGQPAQEIADPSVLDLHVIDLSGMEEGERESEVRLRARREAQLPFNLATGPLWRAMLLRIAVDEHVLLLTMHHIVSDAWSMGILIREVSTLYRAFAQQTRGGHGGPPLQNLPQYTNSRGSFVGVALRGHPTVEGMPLPELAIQYADFASWQRDWLSSEVLDEQLAYWRDQLRDSPELLELPLDRPRPAVQTYRGASEPFTLSQELTEQLQKLSRQKSVTLFMTLLTAFKIVLARYTGADDVVVGTPIAGRNRTELEGLIGFFVNTLVLRTDLSGDPAFEDLLARVREVTLGAYAHQDLPFEKLVEELQPARVMRHAPLFQVMFTLQNAPRPVVELHDLTLAPVDLDPGTSMFDLSLSLEETMHGVSGIFEYNTDLFDAATIQRLARHFQTLLGGVTANPQQRISDLPLLTEGERQLLLSEWNKTRKDYPPDKCLHELIEAQVERTPESVALIFEDEQLTYRELNSRANRLAHHLRSHAVGPEVVVGICMERSLDMVIGLLGIMKAGGAYMPLEPDYPKERQAFMLHDARVSVLLTQQKFTSSLPESEAQIVCIDLDADVIAHQSEQNPSSKVTPANLIYVIYTSGSTGQPKGAMLPHQGVCNCLLWMQERHNLTETDRVLLKAPLSFDSSVWELFWPLLVGASVVVARPGEQRDSAYLAELIARERVTTVHFVPSMFQIFLEEKGIANCDSLKHVVCGGEALSVASIERFYQRGLNGELHNFYGPTETSIGSIDWICDNDTKRRVAPIGRPIANTDCYLLDVNLKPVPIGVSGQLYTGGIGLARGYLGRPALTADKFIPHPFSGRPGARLYQTGDVARYLPDGNIEFLGRADHQVKLRGLRIELGEIEAALSKHPEIRDSVVIVREDVPGDKRLVAYTVLQQGAAVSSSDLRLFLKETLPDFMLPSAFVVLDEIPLTHNIKIDRRALPVPGAARSDSDKTYVAPRTPSEEIIASIWGHVLGVGMVGVYDNFFELGGHSLLATQVMSRLCESFQLELPLRTLFESPTVAELAQCVEQAGNLVDASSAPKIAPVSRDGELPLSFAQQRLWFLDQLVPNSPFYNMPLAVGLSGDLDVSVLERTLSEITRRHEVLRTSFPAIDGEPVQVISPARPVGIAVVDLTGIAEDARAREVRTRARREAALPFDLANGPLWRVVLLRIADDEHVLLLTMHHIVSDAWSMGILIREVTTLYRAFAQQPWGGHGGPPLQNLSQYTNSRGSFVGVALRGHPMVEESPLPELTIQYADFAHWQREWLAGEHLEKQLSYWREQLSDAPELLELSTDRPRPAVQTYRGAIESFVLSQALTERLQKLSRQHSVTLFMTLVTGFKILLARYAESTDVVVGTPVANRTRTETEPLIGFFVNTLVLRTQFRDDPSIGELLKRVREVCLGAYAHQDVPFEKLVEELQPRRDMSHTPLFQVMFTMQNRSVDEAQLPGLEFKPLVSESLIAKFDLTLIVRETAERELWCSFEYNTDLFDAETVRRMARHFERVSASMAADVEQRLSELELITEGEKRQLLNEWSETTTEYPRETCVHQLFEAQAARGPDEIAVVHGEKAWTYAELNRRGNQIAHYLRNRGVKRGEVVGVLLERGIEMVASVLGVLKAGGAYLPLDPSYPNERLAFMLKDARVKILLTQERLVEALSLGETSIVCLDRDWRVVAGESAQNPVNKTNAENLAYVIYTSGSSGSPKGILIPHRAVVRLICNTNYIELQASDRIAQASNASFDAATFEIWGALAHGARLVVISRDVVLSPARFAVEIVEQGITVLFLTTALFNLFAREAPKSFSSIRHLLFGGEAVDPGRVNEVVEQAPPERLLHVYGPTESTTFASWFLVQSVPGGATTIPIGRPISNTQTLILDKNLRPVPPGMPGELCIGGDGLALGYLNRPELTAEKFVPNTFGRASGARLYKTGDRARFLPDGNIEFLGRVDHQVKLRGFRVELEEIEAVLVDHPSVGEAVVVMRADSPGDKRLVAYLAANGEAPTLTPDELREYLRHKLPEYMVPATFVMLDALPLTPNGKIDRRALPSPNGTGTILNASFLGPRNTVELQLAQIWEEVLNVRPISVTDNFFDLGGHSLLAVRLMAQVRKRFGRDLPLDTLFKAATLENLASVIRQEAAPVWSPLVEIQPGSSQKRIFFIHPAGGNIICYVALARHLGVEQSFYGLQARGLDGREEPFTRIEDMAAYYIDAIRSVQSSGPYLLGGWSLGAVVAFEMAQQIQAQGQEVALLALLDSPAPLRQEEEMDEVQLLAALTGDWGLPISEVDLRGLEPDERLLRLLQHGQEQRLVPLDYDLAQARRLLHIFKTNVEARRNYRPRRYADRITLFRAREAPQNAFDNSPGSDVESALGWSALSSLPIDVHDVPGDHISMITEPHVQSLAAKVKGSVNALSVEHQSSHKTRVES